MKKARITLNSLAGWIVDALDCDHTSAKKYGLVCNTCNEYVFLRSGTTRESHTRTLPSGRITKVRGSSIKASFAHFNEKDKTKIAKCIVNSEAITPEQKTKSKSKSKGQRLRLLNNHFWNLIKTSHKMANADTDVEVARASVLSLPEYDENKIDQVLEIFAEMFVYHKQYLVEESTSMHDSILDFITIPSQELLPYDVSKTIESINSPLDKAIHAEICLEVFNLLCTKSNRLILKKLILKSLLDVAISGTILAQMKQAGNLSQAQNTFMLRGFDIPYDENYYFYCVHIKAIISNMKNLQNETSARTLFNTIVINILAIVVTTPWILALNNQAPVYNSQATKCISNYLYSVNLQNDIKLLVQDNIPVTVFDQKIIHSLKKDISSLKFNEPLKIKFDGKYNSVINLKNKFAQIYVFDAAEIVTFSYLAWSRDGIQELINTATKVNPNFQKLNITIEHSYPLLINFSVVENDAKLYKNAWIPGYIYMMAQALIGFVLKN